MISALSAEIQAAVSAALEAERARIVDETAAAVVRALQAGDPDELLDAAGVGKMLGRSAAAVRRAHERGTLGIDGVRVGKRSWRFRRGDVLALARKRVP